PATTTVSLRSTSSIGYPGCCRRSERMRSKRASKPQTINEYLAKLSPERRVALNKLRRTIRTAFPRAEECISYGIPAFRLDGRVVAWFAAASHLLSRRRTRAVRGRIEGLPDEQGHGAFSARSPIARRAGAQNDQRAHRKN